MPLPLILSLAQVDTSPATATGPVSPAVLLSGAAAVGAAGLVLLMQPGKQSLRIAGTVLALAGFAMLFVEVLIAPAARVKGFRPSSP